MYKQIILRLNNKNKRLLLQYLVKKGYDTYKYYKYSIYKTNRIMLYTNNENEISAIIGLKHDTTIAKYVANPLYCILKAYLLYCANSIHDTIITDLEKYAINHRQTGIIIYHMTVNNTFNDEDYINDTCTVCHNIFDEMYRHNYYKDIPDPNPILIYSKEYDPNRNYDLIDYDDYFKDIMSETPPVKLYYTYDYPDLLDEEILI